VEFLKKQDVDGALDLFQKAAVESPDLPTSHYYLGVAWQKKGYADKAPAAYQKALALKPDYAQVHASLGLFFWPSDQGRARQEFRQAVLCDPDLAEAHYNYGLALAQSGRADIAAKEFADGIHLEPKYMDARIQLG
jgi:Tfp pilus assembly protein PilF